VGRCVVSVPDTQVVSFPLTMGAGRACGPCFFVDHIGTNGQGTCTAGCQWYRTVADEDGCSGATKLDCIDGKPMRCRACRAEYPWREDSE
jgi:hypothetical protein